MATPQLLPSGPLYTSGNQIVDGSGNPVRIACIGWSGADGRNGVPDGLYAAKYSDILNAVKNAGFNAIRLAVCDALVLNNDAVGAGNINTTINSDLAGLTCLQVLDKIITYCGTIGLRVIVDSHNNEGSNNVNYGANQPNGIWYDLNSGSYNNSNNTDGGGNNGTVTNALFQQRWTTLATRWASFPAILGYDLRNEPNTYGLNGAGSACTWGTGTVATDIRAMYQTVGNAILAIDSRPLIIVEGPQNYGLTFATGTKADGIAYGTGNTYDASCGDLTAVRDFPVVLNVANKVVYSVHEYPQETSGNALDNASTAKVNNMNAVWGYLMKENIAPVWLGEMGSYFNGTTAQVNASTSWMNMMISYLNGQTAGGPSFSGSQQPIGIDWWVIATDQNGNQVPDFGIFTDWTSLGLRTNQYTLYSQLFFYPASGGSGGGTTSSASPWGTTLTTTTGTIADASGNSYALTSGGQVALNGNADATTANVVKILYVSNLIYYQTSGGAWFRKQNATDSWASTSTPYGNAPVASPNGTDITTTGGPCVVDANGNMWWISGSQVILNNVADTTLSSVTEVTGVGGQVWAKANGLWYYKTLTTDAWAPLGGQSQSPLSGTTSPVASTLHVHVGLGSWSAGLSATSGLRLQNNGVAYQAVIPGTTAASGGPFGTFGNILDQSAHWKWLSPADAVSLSGAIGALPSTFATNMTLRFWNNGPITTTGGTAFFTLSGHTMSGGKSLTLTTPPGESIRDTFAKQSVPVFSNSAGGVTFLQPLSQNAAINYVDISDPSVILDGLQFIDPQSNSGSTILATETANTSFVCRNTVFDGYAQTGGASMVDINTTGTVLFVNCLFIDRQPAANNNPVVALSTGYTSAKFINCTFVAINAGCAGQAIVSSNATTKVQAINCAFFGYTAPDGGNVSYSYCATNAANFTANGGQDLGNNLTGLTASAQFISATNDFRLLPTSALIDAGTIDTTDNPAADDIARTPRTQGKGWDIGCFERPGLGPAEFRPPPIKFW